MNILFVTCARYPTEKAYGVTIGNTMKCLSKAGIMNSVLIWGEKKNDEYGNVIESIRNHPVRLPLKLYNSNLRIVSKLSYLINQIIFSFYLIKFWKKSSEDVVFWTREPMTLILHSIFCPQSRYLIDLHHSAGLLNRTAIRLLRRKNHLQILVLDAELATKCRTLYPETNIIQLPMGVPTAFTKLNERKKTDCFVIGYLGKGYSNGHDNELSEIVEVAKRLEDIPNLKFKFVGLEKQYKESLSQLILELRISADNITFVDHVNHSEVHRELMTFDAGILPYPESEYNSERFPIKILEYAAAGLPIIASSTRSHRRLLSDTFASFYQKGNRADLSNTIISLMQDSRRYRLMAEKAHEFSLKFTYDERVNKLIQGLNENPRGLMEDNAL